MRARGTLLRGACWLLLLPAIGCGGGGGGRPPFPLGHVILLPQLDLELASLQGTRQWVLGIYGPPGFNDDGAGFLVTSFDLLQVDQGFPSHSFARLDGTFPPDAEEGAEILVYGLVSDFGTAYGVSEAHPTPLVTIESYHVVSTPAEASGLDDSVEPTSKPTSGPVAAGAPPPGTTASDCDRALVLSGGIDASNNHARYKENVQKTYEKLEALGYSDDHITVLYDDGTAIMSGGVNIVDDGATKAKVQAALAKFLADMPASCTLTVFVTDHGTGYEPGLGYDGARPALPGDPETGATYAESTFKVDLRKKVYRATVWTNAAGVVWGVTQDKATGRLMLYKREGGDWVLKGSDTNGDGRITEAETGQDVDGDGAKDDLGWNEAQLGAFKHQSNEWDTDADGTNDVRARWDGTRYVFERLVAGTWKEMGRDTTGDFVIDGADGGVDWDLDGMKTHQIGFHEGINLWGTEVLWDDELANLLKPLADKGVHIMVEMIECYSGGFLENLKGIVEKVWASCAEDKRHFNRKVGGKWQAVDHGGFIDNLGGIDIESWNYAADQGEGADDVAWKAAGSHDADQNDGMRWEKPVIETNSLWYEQNGQHTVELNLPLSLEGKVYDMEIIFGLQKPRWDAGQAIDLPPGYMSETIPGGIRVYSATPFPVNTSTLLFVFQGATDGQVLRIQLTDVNHEPIGYVLPARAV